MPDTQKFLGKYRGSVKDIADPENRGRLRASVPDVLGDVDTGWALPCAPYGGKKLGFFAVPPVGSGVWIEFEGGDPSKPIWVGTFWGKNELPLLSQSEVKPQIQIFKGDNGFLLAFDGTKNRLILSDNREENLLEITPKAGTLSLFAKDFVVVEAPKIKLGSQKAQEPAVLGNKLLQYLQQLTIAFNTHVHTCAAPSSPSTPPVVPAQPPQPSLLSQVITQD